MVGLKRDLTSFAYYTLTLMLLSISSSSKAFNTAAGQCRYSLALGIILFVYSFQLVSMYYINYRYSWICTDLRINMMPYLMVPSLLICIQIVGREIL